MADFGLLGALGEGLKSGVAGYQQQKEIERRRALDEALQQRQAQQMQVDMFSKGIQDSGDGNLSFRPDVMAEKQDERTLNYAKAGLLAPKGPGEDPRVFSELLKSKEEASPFKGMIESLKLQDAQRGSDAERKAALFSSQMKSADESARNAEYDPTSYSAVFHGLLPEALKPEGAKKYENDKLAFINSVLRPQSGATITDDEIQKAERTYFPLPGDTPAIVKKKEAIRQQAIEGIAGMAGVAKGSVPAQNPGLIKKQAKKVDPQIDSYAKQYGLDYEAASKLIEMRRQKAGGYGK